jgi:hypothetical protein
MDLKFKIISVKSWESFLSKLTENPRLAKRPFVFRGQVTRKNDHPWELVTSFEKALCNVATRADPIKNLDKLLRSDFKRVKVWELEEGLLREFQRKCNLYLRSAPPKAHRVEWLALMRHYGAPTRLLDWTYSPYGAVFFALDCPPASGEDRTVVWALDTKWLEERVREKCEVNHGSNVWDELDKDVHIQKPETWKRYFKGDYKFVYPVSPFRLNERLTIQQGTFLCQGDISIPFQANLAALQQDNPTAKDNLIALELKLRPSERIRFLTKLYRMNMTRANLYPGLQGFAESLKMRLIFPKEIGGPIQKELHT